MRRLKEVKITMSDKGLADKIGDLLDTADKVIDVAKDNEDTIKEVVGGDEEHDIKDREPLRELHKDEDKVLIVLEHEGGEPEKAGVEYKNGSLIVELGDMEYVAEAPRDILLDTMDTNYSNGVFELEIQRGE
jgi:ABC-type hemin transport system substrate-binding protein